MDDDKKKLIHFNNNIFDGKNDDLYNIVSSNKGYSAVLTDYTVCVLNLIQNSKINCIKKKTLLMELISRIVEIEISNVKIVLDLVTNLGLVEKENNIFVLSPYGKLFLMSDSISQQVDIIRYYFEKANWSKIVPEIFHDNFVHNDAKRYVACMLYRISSDKFNQFEYNTTKFKIQNNSSEIVFHADYNAYQDLLNSKALNYIFKNIFAQLGLLIFKRRSEIGEFDLSQIGVKIFEYYSYGMVEEYKTMIDECWDSYDRGNFQEAFDNALSIIKVVGILPEALNVIGCVYIKKNEYYAAEEIFNFALDMCSDNAMDTNIKKGFYAETYVSIYFNLGLCCVSMGEFFRALHIFNSIKKTVPYNMESLDEVTKEVKKLVVV